MLILLFKRIQSPFIDAVEEFCSYGQIFPLKECKVRRLKVNEGANFEIFKGGLLESKVDKLCQSLNRTEGTTYLF